MSLTLTYKKYWNAASNTPFLSDATGTAGFVYTVFVAGSQNLGSGIINPSAGQILLYTGTQWIVIPDTTTLSSYGTFPPPSGGGGSGMTNPMTTLGDMIYGFTAGAPVRLPIGTSGQILEVVSGIPTWTTPSTGGTVTSISTTSPILGGTITTSGTISIQQAGASQGGYLSSTDWNTFNNKLSSISGTLNRISVSGSVINIDSAYVGQTSITTLGTIATGSIPYSLLTGTPSSLPPNGSAGGDLSGTYPNPIVAQLSGKSIASLVTGLFKYNGTSWVFDTNTYITGNQSITLSSDITGTGTTAITTTIGANKVTYAKIQQASTVVLLGNPTGSTANISEITLGSGLAFSGSTLVSTGSGGTVTSVGVSGGTTGLTTSGGPITTSGTITLAGTLAIANGGTNKTSVTTTPTATSWAGWDSNSNLFSNNVIEGQLSTSGTTQTLTVASAYQQTYTGTTTTVTLPVTSTLSLGQSWMFMNMGSGNLTINSSGSNLVQTVSPNASCIVQCILITGTTAASWSVMFDGAANNAGALITPTLTSPGTSAGSIVSIDGTQTLTNKTITDGVNSVSTPTTTSLGYLGIPQNSQSAAYALVLTDTGKHIYHPSADTTARTFTIPANSSVAFPIGTTITFVNDTSGGTITIAITTDTLVLMGAGTTGSRTLAANGIATILKVTSTRWVINGTNLT